MEAARCAQSRNRDGASNVRATQGDANEAVQRTLAHADGSVIYAHGSPVIEWFCIGSKLTAL